MGFFEKYSDRGGKYRFRLKAGNGEIILSSEAYESSSGRDNGISSVQSNSQVDDRYVDKTSRSGDPYFVLIASNGQVIGTSETYSSTSARSTGKASVKRNGSTSDIRSV